MPKQITLEDAGLFQMTCHLGGISHPPGYPLFTALCQQLVFGTSVIIGNALSAFFALGAVVLLYLVVVEICRERSTALLAAFAYGLTQCLWSQAIIIEVYSFAAFLFLLCWWQILRFVRTKRELDWFLLCFYGGLGLSNHWPLFVLSCVGFLPLFFRHHAIFAALLKAKTIFISFGLLLIGLSPYLLLLQNEPNIAMYGEVNLDNFLPYVLREYYSDVHLGVSHDDKLAYLLWLVPLTAQQLGPIAMFPVLIGLVCGRKILGTTNFLSVLLIYLATTFLLMLLLDFRFEYQSQAVFLPYPVIAMSAVSIMFAFGVRWVCERLADVRRVFIAPLLLLLFASIVQANYLEVDRSGSRVAAENSELVLNALAENAVLFVHGDNHTSPAGYLHLVKRVRPDILLQSLDGLVFKNNIVRENSNEQERLEQIGTFAASSERPIYSVRRLTDQDIDYGLFYEFRGQEFPNKGEPQIFLPEVSLFTDYLLQFYQSEWSTDEHERIHVYGLLVNVAKQYSEYAIRVGFDALSSEQLRRLSSLQETLPGKLSSFRVLAMHNPTADQLLELGYAVEAQLDKSIAKQHDAIAYEIIGQTLLAEGQEAKAAGYFAQSIRAHPTTHNASFCEFVKLTEAPDLALLLNQYDLDPTVCKVDKRKPDVR